MPVYSKSGKHYSHDFAYSEIKTLNEVDLNDEIIFYHHPYDKLQQGINFYNCLDEANWDLFRKNSQIKLIHNNDSETFEIYFVNDLVKTIKDRNLNPQQIYVVVMDENHKDFLLRNLTKAGVEGVNVSVKNYLFDTVQIPDNSEVSKTHKFSSLSRNYRIWRLFVYAELVKRNLIDKFNYSFHNINPYTETPNAVPLETMFNDLLNLEFGYIPQHVIDWLNDCPHELSSANEVRNKWSNVTYDAIRSADFHLIIETHFDQKEFCFDNKLYDRNFAPTSITEKAYKPIACAAPFIVFSTPYYLEDLRNLGFETFSPYINESYDQEEDNQERLNMIVDEIERICNLDDVNYSNLIDNCKKIADKNKQIFLKKKNA
jgi:hypothetical protein